MGVTVGVSAFWDNKTETIVRCRFENLWTWAELEAAIRRLQDMVDSVDHNVMLIADHTASKWLPPGALQHASDLFSSPHPEIDTIAFVSSNRFFRALFDHFIREHWEVAQRQNMIFVSTLDEARQFLCKAS